MNEQITKTDKGGTYMTIVALDGVTAFKAYHTPVKHIAYRNKTISLATASKDYKQNFRDVSEYLAYLVANCGYKYANA
jgi:hypothetical protein